MQRFRITPRLSGMMNTRLVVAAVLVLAGCDNGEPTTTTWKEPARYDYTMDSSCGERLLFGRFKFTVVDGEVTAATRLDKDDQSGVTAQPAKLPTLNDLLDEYERARSNDAYLAKVEYDPTDGHPTRIDIDGARDVMDDEACYRITAFHPNS